MKKVRKALRQTACLFFAAAVLAQCDADGYLVLIRLTMLVVGSIVVATPLVKEAVFDLVTDNAKSALQARNY